MIDFYFLVVSILENTLLILKKNCETYAFSANRYCSQLNEVFPSSNKLIKTLNHKHLTI